MRAFEQRTQRLLRAAQATKCTPRWSMLQTADDGQTWHDVLTGEPTNVDTQPQQPIIWVYLRRERERSPEA